jgi:malate synthase
MHAAPHAETLNGHANVPLLTQGVKELLERCEAALGATREALLLQREVTRSRLSNEALPPSILSGADGTTWTVEPLPDSLCDRRVELVGGTNRQDLLNGLNSGASSYIADLWNLSCSTPGSVVRAHRGIRLAAHRRLSAITGPKGRERLHPDGRTHLAFIPRPLHVGCGSECDGHWDNDQRPGATFFDICVHAAHNGPALCAMQGGITIHLRGVHSAQEADLFTRLFQLIEEHLGMAQGSIRATVVVDTVNAALSLDGILLALRHHCAGVAIDPQGYAADHIALFHGPSVQPLPDRESIGLNAPFLRALSLHVIGTAHRRGTHALGAPAFVLPPEAGDRMLDGFLEMLADKEREAVDGHDGTIVGYPGLVQDAMAEFAKSMPGAHQIGFQRHDAFTAADLVRRPDGTITVESLVGMLRTTIRSFAYRSLGRPAVVQGGRLHDRSSVQLALALLWQWNHSPLGVVTGNGLAIHSDLMHYLVRKETTKLFQDAQPPIREAGEKAATQVLALVLGEPFPSVPAC